MIEVVSTRQLWDPSTEEERKAVLRALQEILSSPHFRNSKRYPALLRFCVENRLAGHADRLKERTLGVEVFDPRHDYDTNSDTVVRYTAGEVRKRLHLYYHEEGRNSQVRITLPSGSYVPEFLLDPGEPSKAVVISSSSGPRSLAMAPEHSREAIHPDAVTMAPEQSRISSPARRSRMVTVVCLGVLAVVVACGAWWLEQTSRQTVVDRFWAPFLRGPKSILLCAGGSVFAPNRFSGVATAGRDMDYPFVSMQSASAIGHLSGLLERSGAVYDIRAASATSLPEMREHPLILLGGYNNEWTMRLVAPLRFRFTAEPVTSITDRDHPGISWTRDRSRPYAEADDYAIIARFRDSTTDSMIVVLAGLGRNGTEGAAQFVTNPHFMQQLNDRLGGYFTSKNVEVVIRTSVIEGKTGAPSIEAVYAW